MTKSRPVLIGNSILATLQVLASAAALGDIIGKVPFALFSILVGAVTVGFNTYVQGIVTPQADVAAYVNGAGQVVAGPAAGVTNGKTVEVIKTEPPASEGTGYTASGLNTPVPPRDDRGQGYIGLAVGVLLVIILVVVLVRLL